MVPSLSSFKKTFFAMFLGQPPQGPAWGKGFVRMSWNVIFLPKAPTVLP